MKEIVFKEVIYKDIKRDSYFVNENGDVYSLLHNKILKPYIDKNGYMCYRLMKDDSTTRDCPVAHLVIHAFIGEPPVDMVNPTVDHIDNVRTNNHVSNLQWLEHDDNCAKITPQRKLQEEQVRQICEMLQSKNYSAAALARQFGVTTMTIWKIKNRQTWVNVSEDYDF